MTDVRFDARTGRLEASREQIDALLTFDDPAGVEGLEEAGAVVEGRLHHALSAALETIGAPVCELGLERGDRRGRGWVARHLAVLLVPAGERRLALHQAPPAFLPDMLARMNDVAPRPRAEPAVRLRYRAGDLARVLSGRDAAEAARLAGPGEHGAAARALVSGLREHWRVEASWDPAQGSPGVRALEVLDTDAGVWLVVPDGGSVELWPSTPTTVFRLLTGLLPLDREIAE
jgi:hypothetical protein